MPDEPNAEQPVTAQDESTPDDDADTFILSGSLTVEDYLAGNKLAGSKAVRRIALAIYVAFVLLIILALAAFGANLSKFSGPAAVSILFTAFGVIPALLFLQFAFARYRLHQSAHQRLGIFMRTHTTFTSEKMVSEYDGVKQEGPWSFYCRLKYNDRVAVLFASNPGHPYLILARSKLQPPQEWPELIDFLRSKYSDDFTYET